MSWVLPTFDWQDIWYVVNGGTALSLLLVGVVFGVLFFVTDRRRAAPLLVTGLTMGLVFTGTMGTVRYLQDADRWEGWIGQFALVAIYGLGMILGAALRRIWERR